MWLLFVSRQYFHTDLRTIIPEPRSLWAKCLQEDRQCLQAEECAARGALCTVCTPVPARAHTAHRLLHYTFTIYKRAEINCSQVSTAHCPLRLLRRSQPFGQELRKKHRFLPMLFSLATIKIVRRTFDQIHYLIKK